MEQLKLNMIPNGVNPVFHASQNDKNRQIRFVLDETLSGEDVTIEYHTPDGASYGNVQLSVSGSVITDYIPNDALKSAGIVTGEVTIDGRGSLNFFVNVEKDAYEGGDLIPHTVSGAIANFETNIVAPMQSITAEIVAVQDLHGYTHPWTGGGGKNLIDKKALMQPCALSSGTRVYAQLFNTSAAFSLYVVQEGLDPTSTSNWTSFLSLSTTKVNNTLPFNISHIGISNSAYSSLGTGNIMVSLSDITEFEPYENICPISGFNQAVITHADGDMQTIDTLTATFGTTVYGGVADVTGGVVEVTHVAVKISDMTWTASGDFFYSSLPLKRVGNTTFLCECLRVVDVASVSAMVNGDIKGHPSNTNMYIKNTYWATATDLYNAIGNYYIVYELATPTEIPITPDTLNTISGVNNVWSDTGDIEVTYLVEE